MFQFIVIHTVKGFGIVNKEEVFLELSCFYDDPTDVRNLISGSSAFSKSRLNIWKFMAHILLEPGLENFEHYFASMWDECNCAVLWTFFGTAFLWGLNENWPFPVLWALLSGGDGIPVELFQILKYDAINMYTQFASKFGKLISGHQTGKVQTKYLKCQFQRLTIIMTTDAIYNVFVVFKALC